MSLQIKSWDGPREKGMMGLLITQQVFHLALLLPGDPKTGIGEGVTQDLQRKETETSIEKATSECVGASEAVKQTEFERSEQALDRMDLEKKLTLLGMQKQRQLKQCHYGVFCPQTERQQALSHTPVRTCWHSKFRQ